MDLSKARAKSATSSKKHPTSGFNIATKPQTELNVQQAVPFFMVTSMEESLRFYVEGLGFFMTKKWTPENEHKIEWCALKVGEAALMLQEYRKGHHPNSGRPDGKLGVGVSICFVCRDALAIYREGERAGSRPRRHSWAMACG